MTTQYLQLHNLTKRFGDQVAIDDLTLGVDRGTVLALNPDHGRLHRTH